MMEAYTHICIIISREEGYGEASVPFMQRDDTVGGGGTCSQDSHSVGMRLASSYDSFCVSQHKYRTYFLE